MQKLLLGTLLVGLVIGCAMEDQESSGVLVDQNSDVEVPEGLTARDFDYNNDKVVDILDLVIASKFFGQEIKECPIGQHENSLGECVDCPQLTNKKGNRDYLPIKFADYVRSDDPTECKLGEEVDMQYRFPHPNGDYFYTYASLTVEKRTRTKGNDAGFLRNCIDGGWICDGKLVKVAVRLLVSQENRDRIREVKIKPHNDNDFDVKIITFPQVPFSRNDTEGSRNYSQKIPGTDRVIKGKVFPFYNYVHLVYEGYENEAPHNHWRQHWVSKNLLSGINIGMPSKRIEDKSDAMVGTISFFDSSFNEYTWSIWERVGLTDKRPAEWMFPEEVRAKYFPEDM